MGHPRRLKRKYETPKKMSESKEIKKS